MLTETGIYLICWIETSEAGIGVCMAWYCSMLYTRLIDPDNAIPSTRNGNFSFVCLIVVTCVGSWREPGPRRIDVVIRILHQ